MILGQDGLVLFVYGTHEGSGRRKNLVDKDEYSLLWRKFDALANDVDELSNSQIL